MSIEQAAKPTYEQLEAQLQDTQHAMGVAIEQRTQAMNQLIEASVALNRVRLSAQALQEKLAEANATNADLTAKLANREG